jgi:hypothetical protein
MVRPKETTKCCMCGHDVGVVVSPGEEYIILMVACTKRECIDALFDKNKETKCGGVHFNSSYTMGVGYRQCTPVVHSTN